MMRLDQSMLFGLGIKNFDESLFEKLTNSRFGEVLD
jgi:hypothetical protein